MANHRRPAPASLPALISALALAGCVAPPPYYYYRAAPAPYYNPAAAVVVAPRPPPPLREEFIVVRPSPAHVWTPRYWAWQNRWVWAPGRWALPPRPGARWNAHAWVPHQHGWAYRPGGWR